MVNDNNEVLNNAYKNIDSIINYVNLNDLLNDSKKKSITAYAYDVKAKVRELYTKKNKTQHQQPSVLSNSNKFNVDIDNGIFPYNALESDIKKLIDLLITSINNSIIPDIDCNDRTLIQTVNVNCDQQTKKLRNEIKQLKSINEDLVDTIAKLKASEILLQNEIKNNERILIQLKSKNKTNTQNLEKQKKVIERYEVRSKLYNELLVNIKECVEDIIINSKTDTVDIKQVMPNMNNVNDEKIKEDIIDKYDDIRNQIINVVNQQKKIYKYKGLYKDKREKLKKIQADLLISNNKIFELQQQIKTNDEELEKTSIILNNIDNEINDALTNYDKIVEEKKNIKTELEYIKEKNKNIEFNCNKKINELKRDINEKKQDLEKKNFTTNLKAATNDDNKNEKHSIFDDADDDNDDNDDDIIVLDDEYDNKSDNDDFIYEDKEKPPIDCSKEIERLNNELHNAVTSYEKAITIKNNFTILLDEENKELLSKLNQKETEIKELNTKYKKHVEELKKIKEENITLRDINNGYNETLDELRNENDKIIVIYNGELNELNNINIKNKKANQILNKELDEYKKQIKRIENENKELKETIPELNSEIEDLKLKIFNCGYNIKKAEHDRDIHKKKYRETYKALLLLDGFLNSKYNNNTSESKSYIYDIITSIKETFKSDNNIDIDTDTINPITDKKVLDNINVFTNTVKSNINEDYKYKIKELKTENEENVEILDKLKNAIDNNNSEENTTSDRVSGGNENNNQINIGLIIIVCIIILIIYLIMLCYNTYYYYSKTSKKMVHINKCYK